MLPFEHNHHQPIFSSGYDLETGEAEAYPQSIMDYNYNPTAYNNTLPFAFSDLPADLALNNTKFDMVRTSSGTSLTHPSNDYPPALLSSGSVGSASSSTVGSPYSGYANLVPSQHDNYQLHSLSYGVAPTIMTDDHLGQDFVTAQDYNVPEPENKFTVPYANVDPHLLSGSRDSIYGQYGSSNGYSQPTYSGYSNSPAPSPVPSHSSFGNFNQPATVDYSRFQRDSSVSSHGSAGSPRASLSGDEDGAEKGRCPYSDCGRVVKDLKAHMLTHQNERPEKCPIATCEYHIKGFARKYDKNRHTLTHYKGTMICGFCPGSGSPGEKSFNRADVFKRHLTSVHNVEQNPPNCRKRSPTNSNKKLSSYCQDATGKCSTCSATFDNAQDFYEHLDDCVLRVVQQEDPREKVNAQRLAEVATDPAVQETFDRHMIKQEDVPQPFDLEDEDDDDDEEDDEEEDNNENANDRYGRGSFKSTKTSGGRAVIGGNISKTKTGFKNGMTRSKIGVSLLSKGKRRRRNYPQSWGMAADKMKMKKRVLCVYDGPRRLLKDDMMLDNEFEVRVKLDDGNSYVTDLDVETLKRAEAFHNATPDEKGPWLEEQELDQDQYFTDLLG